LTDWLFGKRKKWKGGRQVGAVPGVNKVFRGEPFKATVGGRKGLRVQFAAGRGKGEVEGGKREFCEPSADLQGKKREKNHSRLASFF